MPRTKKPPGSAVDRRNGRRTELEATSSLRFSLPKREPPWLPETRRAIAGLKADPVWQALGPVDRPVILRWAESLERAARHLILGDESPIARGSMGQEVESPHYGIANAALRVAAACEVQLGVGAKNRASLGFEITRAKATLAGLNARYGPSGEGDDDDDPRLG